MDMQACLVESRQRYLSSEKSGNAETKARVNGRRPATTIRGQQAIGQNYSKVFFFVNIYDCQTICVKIYYESIVNKQKKI